MILSQLYEFLTLIQFSQFLQFSHYKHNLQFSQFLQSSHSIQFIFPYVVILKK